MSEASDSAHVRVIIADYAVVDTNSKLTIVGGGLSVIALNPANAMTAAFAVVGSVSFDPKFVATSPALVLSLETDDGHLVQLPGIPEPIQLAGSNELSPTRLPGTEIPKEAVRPKVQLLMQFQNGLPLAAGRGYKWRLTVDGETRDEWTESFYVPTAGLRLGG